MLDITMWNDNSDDNTVDDLIQDPTGTPYTLEDLVLDDMTWDIYEEFQAEDELEIQAEYEEQIRQYNDYYGWVDEVMERYDRMMDRNRRDIP